MKKIKVIFLLICSFLLILPNSVAYAYSYPDWVTDGADKNHKRIWYGKTIYFAVNIASHRNDIWDLIMANGHASPGIAYNYLFSSLDLEKGDSYDETPFYMLVKQSGINMEPEVAALESPFFGNNVNGGSCFFTPFLEQIPNGVKLTYTAQGMGKTDYDVGFLSAWTSWIEKGEYERIILCGDEISFYKDNICFNMKLDGMDIFRMIDQEGNDLGTEVTLTEDMKVKLQFGKEMQLMPKGGTLDFTISMWEERLGAELTCDYPYIGDNTNLPVKLKVVTEYPCSYKLYLNKKEIGSGNTETDMEKDFMVDTSQIEGDFQVRAEIYDRKGYMTVPERVFECNKKNVLNKIIELAKNKNGLEQFFVAEDKNRYFEKNTVNENLVKKIKNTAKGTYFIMENISPVLSPLLEK